MFAFALKARRKTATPEDLLFAGGITPSATDGPVSLLLPLAEIPEDDSKDAVKSSSTVREAINGRDSDLMPPPKSIPLKSRHTGTSSQTNRSVFYYAYSSVLSVNRHAYSVHF